ncbi:CDP-diacylglycerol--serine O-phosphatidyltransferase [Aurantivibrio plasticivorans]
MSANDDSSKVSDLDSRREAEADFGLPFDDHVEEVSEGGKTVRRRGIFLLPNLITTAALFSGFYAIVAGMHGNFENAAIAIFVAMVFDGLDGRVARLTNTSSAFGVEYDSLSDMVSFGLAPSLVMFNWGLAPLGKYGWAMAFAFAACAALRLARFNTQVETADKRYFTGLASPSAAALVAGTVWFGHEAEITFELSLLVGLLTLTAGLLMVSNIKYHSFKGLDFKGRVPFVKLLLMIMLFVVIVANPSVMLVLMAAIYATSGPLMWLWEYSRKKRADD